MPDFTINRRLKAFIDKTGLNQSQFAKKIDISPSRLSNVLHNRNKPDSELLSKVLIKFRNLDARWLLTGEFYKVENDKDFDLMEDIAVYRSKYVDEIESLQNKLEVQRNINKFLEEELNKRK